MCAAPAGSPTTLRGAQILCHVLEAEGVDVIFGYPGGAILPTYDALRDSRIHHVLVRHEQGAAHMADGFARASGRVGVAMATSGPGATNLVTGIATAFMDSIPIVCITGQVPSAAIGTDAFQEADILGLVTPITKHAILVRRPEDVAAAIREAFGVARSGRPGPVVVDITKDAQLRTAELIDPGPYTPPTPPRPPLTEADLDRATELLQHAERPLILCGHGVIAAGAAKPLRLLAERLDAPVASTLLGLGALSTSHPLHLGMMGMHGHAWVNQAIQQADLLLAVGMRFDDRVTGDPTTFAPGARILHIELDAAEIGKVIPTEMGLCGDASEVLHRLLPRLTGARHPAWRGALAEAKAAEQERDLTHRDATTMSAPGVIAQLATLIGPDATVATDVGQHQMWQAQSWQHSRPRCLLTSGGLGTMGYALPAAIGARFARPDAEIWVVVGDGGFQMTACELSTLTQERLKLNILLVNNASLGMVRQLQEMFYEERYIATPLHNPDFDLLSRAHGLTHLHVRQRDHLAAAIEAARATPGSCVIELEVPESEIVYPMVPSGGSLSDMIRHPAGAADDDPPERSAVHGPRSPRQKRHAAER